MFYSVQVTFILQPDILIKLIYILINVTSLYIFYNMKLILFSKMCVFL